MKLIQANIWGGRLGKLVTAFLRDEQPDIVCLQEAISADGSLLLAKTVQQISEAAELRYIYLSPVFSFSADGKQATFGNSILSRTELVGVETMFTNLSYNETFNIDTDDKNIRNIQHAVIAVGDTSLHILNHQGRHIREHKNGDELTLQQCDKIADYIAELDGPVVLAGDFNLAPHSKSLQKINAQLRNLSLEYKLRTTRNQLTNKIEVCDYIFVNDLVQVRSFHMAKNLISDHQALVLEFEV